MRASKGYKCLTFVCLQTKPDVISRRVLANVFTSYTSSEVAIHPAVRHVVATKNDLLSNRRLPSSLVSIDVSRRDGYLRTKGLSSF